VRAGYKPAAKVPYHNFAHAADVFQMTYFLSSLPDVKCNLHKLDLLALYIAAICHDIGHTGTNNAFHVATKSKLALRYHERAPLENHHAAYTSRILAHASSNILDHLAEEEQARVRRSVVELILATDMATHKSRLDAFCSTFPLRRGEREGDGEGNEQEANADADAGELGARLVCKTDEEALLLMTMVLNMSDISNVCRPLSIATKWTQMVAEEFFQQGDRQEALGLPVAPMNSRRLSTSQSLVLGFLNFVAKPFFREATARIPGAACMYESLLQNQAHFESA
jgi:hypothetical protein